MPGLGFYLEIDASDLTEEIERLRSVMQPERFEQCMYGIFSRTEGHVRKILKKDIPHQYHIKAGLVGSAIKHAKVTFAGGNVGCTIPVRDRRGSIGGRYSASGGKHGWASTRGKKYRVKAKVVKAGTSTLPLSMDSYGGEPPFRNLGSSLGGLAFTRAGKARLPIMQVKGIAIPQMPMNRSQGEVQADILEYMKERIEHEFQRIIAGG